MAATAQTAVAAPSRTATPSDYLRMPFTLPSGSLPVGLLACQRDPLLRSLETRIVRAHKAPTSAFALTSKWKSKGGKNKANDTNSEPGDAPAKTAGELWEVQLQDTTLFPEGGGQPSDTGFLILLDPQGSSSPLVLRVESAIRCNLDAVHFVRVPTSAEPSRIPDSLVEGSRVRVEVDWDRRRDHMEMHTGQHLLSALLEHRHNLPTLGWALTTFPQPSYVELPRAPTAEEIEAVSRDAEELIAAGTRVNVDVRREEALGERPESMPDDYGKEGVIRTVEISGVDRNP